MHTDAHVPFRPGSSCFSTWVSSGCAKPGLEEAQPITVGGVGDFYKHRVEFAYTSGRTKFLCMATILVRNTVATRNRTMGEKLK